jgi:hypothetical protein
MEYCSLLAVGTDLLEHSYGHPQHSLSNFFDVIVNLILLQGQPS